MWVIVNAFYWQSRKCFLLTLLEEGESYQLPDLERLVSNLFFPTAFSPVPTVSLHIVAGYYGTFATPLCRESRKDNPTVQF